MNQLITQENYESFYLDFLEGNLSERDAASLLAFLDQHPELKLEEDPEWITLSDQEVISMDASFKNSLKFPDTTEAISTHNIDTFLIASIENELSPAKEAELKQFVQQNPTFATELTWYQRTRLQPNTSVVYPHKAQLKKGGFVVPMWTKYAAVAASLAWLIWMIDIGNSSTSPAFQANKSNKSTSKDTIIVTPPLKTAPIEPSEIQYAALENKEVSNASSAEFSTSTGVKATRNTDAALVALKPLEKQPIAHPPIFKDLVSSNVGSFVSKNYATNSDVASFKPVEMSNPIQPVTRKISSVLNTEIDFKTSIAARKKGGFYLKIGKLEISRKVYDESVAIVHE